MRIGAKNSTCARFGKRFFVSGVSRKSLFSQGFTQHNGCDVAQERSLEAHFML